MMRHLRNLSKAFLACFVCFLILATSGAKSESDPTETVVQSTFSYSFGVHSNDNTASYMPGVIALEDWTDPLHFYLHNGDKERLFAIHVFLDYQQVPIEVDGTVWSPYLLPAESGLEGEYTFHLTEPVDTSRNHKLLVILVAGADILSSHLEGIRSPSYSMALDYVLTFDPEGNPEQAAYPEAMYPPEQTEIVADFQTTGISLHASADHVGRKIPDAELNLSAGENFALYYQAGGFSYQGQVAVLITVGLQQASLNGQPFLLCDVPRDQPVRGMATLQAPEKPGEYEVMGWIIANPFDNQPHPYTVQLSCYRFTLRVE